jgi:transposase
MVHIVAGILLLVQQLTTLQETPEYYRPARCPHCGKEGVWCHGYYSRKADRSQSVDSLNPIPISRFFCPYCQKTCSALPECISPRRWYLCCVQQVVLFNWVSGESLHTTSKQVQPSRSTCRRWLTRFKEQFWVQRDALCAGISALCHSIGFEHFWQLCLGECH